jgi:hypothetical protein
MKLCGFEVGLNRPFFLMAGSVVARSRGPFGDATAEALVGAGARRFA